MSAPSSDCTTHPTSPAVGFCNQCGRPVCVQCRVTLPEGIYCREDAVEVLSRGSSRERAPLGTGGEEESLPHGEEEPDRPRPPYLRWASTMVIVMGLLEVGGGLFLLGAGAAYAPLLRSFGPILLFVGWFALLWGFYNVHLGRQLRRGSGFSAVMVVLVGSLGVLGGLVAVALGAYSGALAILYNGLILYFLHLGWKDLPRSATQGRRREPALGAPRL